MRIVESNVTVAAQRSFSREQSQMLAITYEAPSVNVTSNEAVSISDAAKLIDEQEKALQNDPKLRLIKAMLESFLGIEINLGHIQLSDTDTGIQSNTPDFNITINEGGTRVDYSEHETESETTQFNTHGVIKTEDGREISFNAELNLSRSFEHNSSVSVATGSLARPKKDPLVLNYATSTATLASQTFQFDLDSDGKKETISQLNRGSAYLALDKNNDGKINNGNELFGASSGNGFADLSQYDHDKNGWIDSGDRIFGELKLWLKDSDGQDAIKSLDEMKIGAIYLGYAKGDFDLNDSNNRNLGQIRSSGIYLREDGTGGSVQQLDLSV
jgi:hypothetical protein